MILQMNLLAKMILIMSLTQQASSSCTFGCLSCNEKLNCTLCDFQSGYYFKDFNCIKTNINKCAAIDLNGNCLYCNVHYFLDTSNNKCRTVHKSKQQAQCTLYSTEDICLHCSGNYYPLNGKCVVLVSGQSVSNCLIYQGLGVCASCNTGYLPNYLGNTCLPNSSSSNCLLRTNIQCSACPSTYMQNNDYLRIKIQLALKSLKMATNQTDLNTNQERMQQAFDTLIKKRILVQDNCLLKTVLNCANFEKFDKCSKCNTQYYLEKGLCVAQPKEAIPFCMIYTNLLECTVCSQGYFRETSKKCSPVKVIGNCEVYNGALSQSICSNCDRNYFLQTNTNTCAKRQNLVDLCDEYEKESDKCKKCLVTDINYILTTDKLQCLEDIYQCMTYEVSDINTTEFVCTACLDNYYWSLFQKRCIQGEVAFCRIYETNRDNCVECVNGYFLQLDQNGVEKCIAHHFQEGCLTYNNRDNDECSICNEGFIMLSQTTDCVPVSIEGCSTYINQTKCGSCSDGYDLSNGICFQLNESSNCVRSVNKVCLQCASSYQKISGQCFPGFEYQQQHCFNSFLDGTTNYNGHTCNICQKYAVPFNQKNHFMCISNKQLEIFYQYNLYSSYCDSYSLDSQGILRCNSCREGYIFQNLDCVEACGTDETSLDDFLLVTDSQVVEERQLIYRKDKTCFGNANGRDVNADKYGQNEQFNRTFSPLNFTSTKAFKSNHNATTEILIATQKNVPFGRAVSQNLYVFPQFTSTITVGNDNKCYLFQDNPNTTDSCSTCKFGHFSIIENWHVTHCHTYNATKCIKCVYGMIPAADGLSCLSVTQVKGCKRYSHSVDKCLECHSQYYLDYVNQSCIQNVIGNCLYPHKFLNKCWKCQDNYILNTTSDKCLAIIDNCKKYDLTGNSSVCLLCHNNYYLTNGSCLLIPDKHCWFWEQGSTGANPNGFGQKECLFYSNTIEITQIDQCSNIATVLHCADYQDENTCVGCEDAHYLVDGYCCAYNTYPGTGNAKNAECTGNEVTNCRTYKKNASNEYICHTCDFLYHLTAVNTTKGKCCQYYKYWENNYDVSGVAQITGTCQSTMNYQDGSNTNRIRNTPNCMLFSNDMQHCNTCLTSHYFSHGHCCPITKYWNDTNKACQSIQTDKSITNCEEWSDTESEKCSKCATGNLISNQCCATTEYLEVDPTNAALLVCKTIPAGSNCTVYNKDSFCTTCASGFYKSETNQKKCCTEVINNTLYYNLSSESCATVTTSISKCTKYNASQVCIECFSDGNENNSYWLNPQNTCCKYQQYWDGTHCQGIENDNIYDCWKVEKGKWKELVQNNALYDYMCSGCEDGKQLIQITDFGIQEESVECKSITSVSNCKTVQRDYEDGDPLVCIECKDKFAIQYNNFCCGEGNYKSTDVTTCSDMFTQVENCYYFNMEKFKCQEYSSTSFTTSHAEYDAIVFDDKGACSWNISEVYHFDSADTSAPKQCHKVAGFNTTPTSITNCEVYLADGSGCLQCERGFLLIDAATDTCVSQSNCITSYSAACLNCKSGFYYASNGAGHCDVVSATTAPPTPLCSITDGTNCTKCQQGYQLFIDPTTTTIRHCCKYGYYFNFDISDCIQIESDFCSKQSSSTINSSTGKADCDECFVSDDMCDDVNTLFFDIEQPHYSSNFSRTKIQASSLFQNAKNKIEYYHYKNVWRDTTKKQCCSHGQHYSLTDKKCVTIGIDNCLQGEYSVSNQQNQCTLCEVGYELTDFKCEKIKLTNCNSAQIDPVDGISREVYATNNNCCLVGTMWSVDDDKCIPIIDPFCLKSNMIGKCAECKTGYSNASSNDKITLPIINFTFMNFNTIERCPKIERNFKYFSCIPNTIVSDANIYTYDNVYNMIKNCGEFDFTTAKKCKKCMSYAYMADSVKGICCLKGELLVDNLCQKTEELDIIDNCYGYDIENKTCLKCKSGYHLQQGHCCQEGHYIDPYNNECKFYYPDCANFLIEFSTCERCYPGYYMSYGRCCRYGTRWIDVKQQCVSFTVPNQYACSQGATEALCAKCIDSQLQYEDNIGNTFGGDIYMYNGICYGERSFNPDAIDSAETNAEISTLRDLVNADTGMYFCAKVDEYNNCTECIDGYNLYTHTFSRRRRRLAISYAANNTHTICCPSGYHYHALTDSGFICQDYNYNGGCDKMKLDGGAIVCDTCLTGFYKSFSHCCKDKYAWSTTKKMCVKIYISELHNCLENARDSDNQCTKCQTGYYLSPENRCCKNGFYWNTDASTCLSITLLSLTVDCNQVLKDGNNYICSKCTDGVKIYDSTNTLCSDKVANNPADQNCNVKTNPSSGDDTCTHCADGSYKTFTTQNYCCQEGYFYDVSVVDVNARCVVRGSNTLVSNSFQNCKTLLITDNNGTPAYDCTCIDDFYKVGETNVTCTAIDLTQPNTDKCALLRQAPDTNCAVCDFGSHILDSAKTTCVVTFIDSYGENSGHCAGDNEATNAGECIYCETGFYKSKKRCCLQGFYWNSDIQQCHPMHFEQDIFHCSQNDDNVTCQKCDNVSDFYKANENSYVCCPKGYYYQTTGNTCNNDFSGISNSFVKCNLFEIDDQNNLQCRNFTSSEYATNNNITACNDSTYYFTNKRCCSNNEFFQISGQNCIDIASQYSEFVNCKQLNDENLCKECKDANNHYISNGNCCTLGQYMEIDDSNRLCKSIAFDSACRKMTYNKVMRQYQCTQCTNANNNEKFPECCEGKYLPSGQALCLLNLPSCQLMSEDATTPACLTCDSNYYLTNGHCCLNGFYYNEGCSPIPSNLNCLQVSKVVDSQPYCSLCNITIDLLQVTDGKCCKKDYIYIKSHPLDNCFPYKNLFEYCEVFDKATSKCTECQTNYDLSNGICCQKGYHSYLDQNNYHGCTLNRLNNCLIQDSQTKCSTCETGYYLANNNQTCCKTGYQYANGSCSESVVRENCTGFDANNKCTSCVSGYYISADQNENTYCCEEGKYIKIFQGKPVCVAFRQLADDCNKWDTTNNVFECTECEEDTYKTGPICCPDTSKKYFDKETGTCGTIPHSWCYEMSDEGNCTVCEDNTYYVTNGRCCPLGRYWDAIQNYCLDNSRALCEKYVDGSTTKCKSCMSTFIPAYVTTSAVEGVRMIGTLYIIQEHCCNNTYFWDDSKNECVKKIENCQRYKDNKNSDGTNNNGLVQCESCIASHQLTKDFFNCCANYEFYHEESKKCVSNILTSTVYEGCIDWSEHSLLCLKCDPKKYYLSSSNTDKITLCCKYDQYVDDSTKKCANINKQTYPRCKQVSSGNCSQCEDGYALKTSNHTCILILNWCAIFDAETSVCSGCDSEHYLTQGICCDDLKFGADVSGTKQCVTSTAAHPQIDHCLKYVTNDNTKCAMCIEKHYISFADTKCISDLMFWNGTAEVEGNVKYCEKYGETADICLRCIHNHSLMSIKANAEIPLDENLLTTSLRTFYTTNTTGNKQFCVRTELQNCLNSNFLAQDTNSDSNKVQCTSCKRNQYVVALASSITAKKQHFQIPHCRHTISHSLYSLSTFQCVECEHDYYLNKANHECHLRTSEFTSHCINRDLFSNKCLICDIKYSLLEDKCIIPASPCQIVNGSNQCQACNYKIAYTYFMDSEPLDQQCKLHSEFDGESVEHSPPDIFHGYMRNCEPHHQCTDQFLSNLNVNTHKYLSCHVCNDSNRIPFISLKIASDGVVKGPLRYSMWNQNTKKLTNYLKDQENKQSECFKTDFSEFTLPVNQTSDLFPSNCAVGAFNSMHPLNMLHSKKNNSDADFDYTKASAFCIECKPGYKATRNTFFSMVRSCDAISNCLLNGGTSFSQCDECVEGYYFKYNGSKFFGGVDKGECIKSDVNHDQHCYAFDTTNTKCHTCKNGYSKNHDGKCEKLSSSFCETNFNFNQKFAKEEFVLAYYRGEQGCTKCQSGYERIYRKEDDFVCFSSSYQLNLPETTNYVHNCEYYHNQVLTSGSKKLKCYKCADSFIITNNGICITRVTAHDNCKIAVNDTTCHTCSSSFYLINGVCTAGETQNCNVFVIIDGALVCNTCQNYHFLNSTKQCQKGEIEFCRVFSGLSSCVTCDANYQLVILKDNHHYCLPIEDQTNNCLDQGLSTTEIASMNIHCTTCSPKTLLQSITSRKVCVRFNLIKDCIKYNRGSNFANSTFKCDQCQGQTYLNTKGQCQDRTKNVTNCFKYSITQDNCQECYRDYWIDSTKLICQQNPLGLVGCSQYQSETVCSQCFKDFYLLNGKCVILPTDNKIPGCTAYNSTLQCVGCETGTTLVGQICEANSVLNCSIHETPTSCKDCKKGFGISNVDNLNKCISLTAIPGCLSQSQFEPYLCDVCEANFYLGENGLCTALDANKQIANCLVYGSQQLCEKCGTGYALSSDTTKCFKIHETITCLQSFETKSNFCDLCLPGHKLDTNGSCVSILASEITGCFTTKYDVDNQCGVCNFGFYMTKEFTCLSNLPTDIKNPDENNKPDNGNGGNGIGFMKIIMKLGMILFFVY